MKTIRDFDLTNKNNELNINSKTYNLNILINKTVRLGIGKDNNN